MNEIGVIYARLSREEDSELNKKSLSIENQIQGLLDYAKEHKIKILKVYSDDGFTGGNLNRPGLIELLNDMYKRKFNILLIKDISRLGRVMHQVGHLLEDVFPNNSIQVISVNDDYNSKTYHGESIVIKNFLNDYYLKDFKRKCHNALLYRAHTIHLNYYPKYGYYFDSERKEQVDPYASKIVKQIFYYAIDGKSTSEIAATLNENGVLTRSRYAVEILGLNPLKRHPSLKWKAGNVWEILKDYEYVGHSLNLVRKENPPILLKNTHHAIISEEMFKKANEKIKRKIKNNNYDRLTKILIDANSGKTLTYVTSKSKENEDYYYSRISKYSIKVKKLKMFLYYECIKILKDYIKNDQVLTEICRKRILQRDSLDIDNLKKQLEILKNKFTDLSEQFFNNQINRFKFEEKSKVISNQINTTENNINNYQTLFTKTLEVRSKLKVFLEVFDNDTERIELIRKMISTVIINHEKGIIIINYKFGKY